MRVAAPLPLDAHDAAVLRGWAGDPTRPSRGRRARIVLLCAAGYGPSAVAARLRCSKQTVIAWRDRYIAKGLDGLRDEPRSGRPVTVNPAAVVLGTLQPADPPGVRWSTRTLGARLGISNVAVSKVWRGWGIRPEPGGRVSLRTEPVLDVDVLAVLGLHIDPPVQLLAVAVTDPRPRPGNDPAAAPAAGPVAGPARRRGLGGVLDDVLASAPAGAIRHRALQGFLAALDHTRCVTHEPAPATATAPNSTAPNSSVPTPTAPISTAPADQVTVMRTVLLAAGDVDSVHELAHECHAVALHTVTTPTAWACMVRVACLLASHDPVGAASVDALRVALTDHPDGPFTWLRPQSVTAR